MKYVPLQFGIFDIRIISNRSFQNFQKKHSQVGFVFSLAGEYNN